MILVMNRLAPFFDLATYNNYVGETLLARRYSSVARAILEYLPRDSYSGQMNLLDVSKVMDNVSEYLQHTKHCEAVSTFGGYFACLFPEPFKTICLVTCNSTKLLDLVFRSETVSSILHKELIEQLRNLYQILEIIASCHFSLSRKLSLEAKMKLLIGGICGILGDKLTAALYLNDSLRIMKRVIDIQYHFIFWVQLDYITRALQYSIFVENMQGIDLIKELLSNIRNLKFAQNSQVTKHFLDQISIQLEEVDQKVPIWLSRPPVKSIEFQVNVKDMPPEQLLRNYSGESIDINSYDNTGTPYGVSPISEDSETTDIFSPIFLEPLLNGTEDSALQELEKYLLSE